MHCQTAQWLATQAALCRCNHTCEDSYSNHTYEDLLFIQVCSPTTPAHCSTIPGKMHCPSAQCCCATQADSRLVPAAITPVKIHTAITPMKICCSYRSAVPPHQRTAVQIMAKCIAPLHSAAVQHRLTAGLCRCNHTCEDSYSNHTYEDLLFIQVCSPTTPAHCSTNHGKMHCPSAQCCCATQADSRLVPAAITPVKIHTAITPMKICCSYRSAVPPHQRTAVQIMAKCIAPDCTVLFCNTG